MTEQELIDLIGIDKVNELKANACKFIEFISNNEDKEKQLDELKQEILDFNSETKD